MIDRAIGGLVPLVQDDLSFDRALVSLGRCGLDCTSFLYTGISGKTDFLMWQFNDSLRTPASVFPLYILPCVADLLF